MDPKIIGLTFVLIVFPQHRFAFLRMSNTAYKSYGKMQTGESENRPPATLCFISQIQGPKVPSARIRVPKPLHPMMFEHCDSHIAKVVDLPVVFQRFGGTQIASWGPPDRRTHSLTHRDQSRPGPGPVWAGRRPAGCPPCAQDMRGHPVGRKRKVSRSRAASPPFTPILESISGFSTGSPDFSI